MLRSFKAQLIGICLFSFLVFVIILIPSSNIIRAIFSFPVAFFLPGYTLLLVLYPRRCSLGAMERLLFSFALSMAIVTLILLVLNYIWNLNLYPSLIAVIAFILIMTGISWWRQKEILPEDRFTSLINLPLPFNLNSVLRSRKFILWLLLIISTVMILLFPVQIKLDYSLMEAFNIFPNIPLFIGLFLIWMATLLFLLFSKKESKGSSWEKLALACVFVLVFVNFWIVNTPYGVGSDGLTNMGLVKTIEESGNLPQIRSNYFQFPGLIIFSNFFTQLMGIDHFTMAQVLRFVTILVYAGLIFLFCNNILSNPGYALIALLLIAVLGGTLSPGGSFDRTAFRPDLIGGVLLISSLVILSNQKYKQVTSTSSIIMLVIFLCALVVTYVGHSLVFLFIPLGIYLLQMFTRTKNISATIIILTAVCIVTWGIYYATSIFQSSVKFFPDFFNQLIEGDKFYFIVQSSQTTLTETTPLWVSVFKYARWVFLGTGTVWCIIRLIRIRKLAPSEILVSGSIIGLLLLTLLTLSLSRSGFEFQRYLLYSPIFLAPAIIQGFLILKVKWKKLAIGILVVCIFIFALPSFLVYYGTSIVYPAEIEAGEFLEANFKNDSNLTVYSNQSYGSPISRCYLYNTIKKGPPEPPWIKDKDDLINEIDLVVNEFQTNPDSIFIYSKRMELIWQKFFTIDENDSYWQEVKQQLAGENNEYVIFSNEYIYIYSRMVGIAK